MKKKAMQKAKNIVKFIVIFVLYILTRITYCLNFNKGFPALEYWVLPDYDQTRQRELITLFNVALLVVLVAFFPWYVTLITYGIISLIQIMLYLIEKFKRSL